MKISIGGHAITILTMAYLCRFSSFSSRAENGFPDNAEETNPAGVEPWQKGENL